MIESREQRKKSSLLHRRRIAIVAAVLLVVILGGTCIFLANFFNTVIPFEDFDGKKYKIKLVEDGVYALYDKDGNICPTEEVPGTTLTYYVTEIGTVLTIDKTGTVTIETIPDLYFPEDGESVQYQKLAIFKGVDDSDITKIEVKNQYGSYTLQRWNVVKNEPDNKGEFVLKNSPLAATSKQMISYLVYTVGHAYAESRIEDPITDDDGGYSEYGLAKEERIDDDGNTYEYSPSSYTITLIPEEGKKAQTHTIYIGDRLVNGEGYYVQYENNEGEKRPAVYVFDPDDMSEMYGSNIESTLLASVNDIVSPMITYPFEDSTYFEVTNFSIKERVDGYLDEKICFSFRDNTADGVAGTPEELFPFVFVKEGFKNYRPDDSNIDKMLKSLKEPLILGVEVLHPEYDDLVSYGLMEKITDSETGKDRYVYRSAYVIQFTNILALEDNDGNTDSVEVTQTIYISKPTAEGDYYTFTSVAPTDPALKDDFAGFHLDTICKVSQSTLEFVTWERHQWIKPQTLQVNINNVEQIQIYNPNYMANFNIKHTDLGGASTKLVATKITGYDGKVVTNSSGTSELTDRRDVKTFDYLSFTDKNGFIWTVTEKYALVYDPVKKTSVSNVEGRHFTYNSMDAQVQVIDGYVTAKSGSNVRDGSLVYIEKDYIKIIHPDQTQVVYLRHQTAIFRNLFLSIINISIAGTYDISKDEAMELVTKPENQVATIKIFTDDDKTLTCSFYRIPDSSRKYYMVFQGDGGFYVAAKDITDMLGNIDKFYNWEIIDR